MTSSRLVHTFIPSTPLVLLALLHIATSTAQATSQNADVMSLPISTPTPTLSPSDRIPQQPAGDLPRSTPLIASTPSSTNESHSSDPNQDDESSGVLNYYFLLLALFIIVLGIAYLFYVRRQRNKVARSRRNGQHALARDLERWGGGPWGPPRFRFPRQTVRQSRREEGLNERGEAPPPYMPKEPEQALFSESGQRGRTGQAVPLQDMVREEHKPPDYDEGSSARGAPRPNPRYG